MIASPSTYYARMVGKLDYKRMGESTGNPGKTVTSLLRATIFRIACISTREDGRDPPAEPDGWINCQFITGSTGDFDGRQQFRASRYPGFSRVPLASGADWGWVTGSGIAIQVALL